MAINIQCPHCRQSYDLTPEQAPQYSGQVITCTTCQQAFQVPPLGQVPPAPMAYGMPGGYAQPAPNNNGAAVASLVLGILGFCLPVLASIPAIILGIIGLRATSTPAGGGGRGLAIAGLVLGCVSMVMVALPLAIVLPAIGTAKERAQRVHCASNLRQIGMGLALYANDHKGQLPPDIQVLVNEYDLMPHVFCCPSSSDTPAITADALTAGHLSYVYLPHKNIDQPADIVVAHERIENHNGEGMNVLFMDGHVEWYSRDHALQLLQDLQAGRNPPR